MSGLKRGPISEARAEARTGNGKNKATSRFPFGNDKQGNAGGSVALRLGKKSVRVNWVK
jgi:hypothetical protein